MYLDKQSGYWVVKGGCAAVADLPPVTFVIGGTPYALPPQLWTRPVRPSIPKLKPGSPDKIKAPWLPFCSCGVVACH